MKKMAYLSLVHRLQNIPTIEFRYLLWLFRVRPGSGFIVYVWKNLGTKQTTTWRCGFDNYIVGASEKCNLYLILHLQTWSERHVGRLL